LDPSCTRQVTPVPVCVMSRLSFAAVHGTAMLHYLVWLHVTKGQLCCLCPSFHVMRTYRRSGGNFETRVIIFTLQPFCPDPALRSRYSDCVTGWTVRGSNSGNGEEFSSAERPDRHWSPANLLFSGYGGFLGGKAAGSRS
jgi:hypothetical protein